MTTTAVRLHDFGRDPADVIRVESIPLPPPADDELQLEMLASPINPADLNVIQGTYGELPDLPATIGNEGCGRVVAIGSQVTDFAPGDLVATSLPGCWCTHRNLPAADAVPVPAHADPQQAAMLGVNPPSAYGMLHGFVDLQPGDWIVQNAANSGVGRCVIALAGTLGVKTLNLVRRPELIPELTALGADLVVLEDTDLRKENPFGDRPPRLALNAVGGPSALNLASALAPGGTHVTYGAMSRQPVKIPNGLLIFKDLNFRGFWLRRWFTDTPAPKQADVFSELASLVADGSLRVPIARTYPIAEILSALSSNADSGKTILTP